MRSDFTTERFVGVMGQDVCSVIGRYEVEAPNSTSRMSSFDESFNCLLRTSIMKIPIVLENKYRTEHKLNSFVSTAVGRIEGHLQANPMVFFPEYTDHGITHLESTLQTTVDLATGKAQNLMTAADSAEIAVAVGLHDLGMYLT